MKDYYKPLVVIGWILILCSVVQMLLFPIFIVPLPIFFIPAAILFLIAALVKKMETAFPTYLNNDKESFIYNLKIVSYLCFIVAALPLALGIYNYVMLETPPSLLGSIVNLIGLGVAAISIVILFMTGYVIKLLNYGTKKMRVYTFGYNTSSSAGSNNSNNNAYQNTTENDDYNDEADYDEEKEK